MCSSIWGADEYSDRSLAFLEAEINRLAEQVRAGREVLAGRLGGAQQGEERERAQEPSRRFAGWSVDPTASHKTIIVKSTSTTIVIIIIYNTITRKIIPRSSSSYSIILTYIIYIRILHDSKFSK